MKQFLLAGAAALLAACSGSESGFGGGAELDNSPFKALIYSRTAGFRHTSIEVGIAAIEQLGADNGFSVDATEDPTAFTPENLANYDLLIWLNTTLDVLDTPEQQAAFENFIKSGGGFVGIHSAADTHHDWPFYSELVAAQFLAHPLLNQPGTLRIEDPDHPSMAHLGDTWSIPIEEYYSFKSNPRGAVRVLMNIDESSYLLEPNTSCNPAGPTFPQGYSGEMGDHPMSWCHDKFAGRAWYTALGHSEYLYQQEDFLQHILQGILVAARRVPAQCGINPKPVGVPEYVEPVLEGCENQLLPF
nr:ThuA domain-containing protein [Oceanococcus sp. HetDA_MAG_MS8]